MTTWKKILASKHVKSNRGSNVLFLRLTDKMLKITLFTLLEHMEKFSPFDYPGNGINRTRCIIHPYNLSTPCAWLTGLLS